MSDRDSKRQDDLDRVLRSVRRRLRQLTVAVVLMTLALFLTCAAVFGSLVNYFNGDAALFGGVGIGAAVLGFLVGWFARGRR
jgi:peptidoglycan/LPS O-acetylase OafA/YrhL